MKIKIFIVFLLIAISLSAEFDFSDEIIISNYNIEPILAYPVDLDCDDDFDVITISGWCPSISSDGKYFFFAAYPQVPWKKYFKEHHTFDVLQEITLFHPAPEKADIFWMEVKVIEELKPKELKKRK